MPRRGPDHRRVVFSTDRSHLDTCPTCGEAPCRCPAAAAVPAAAQQPRVRRESKGRGGKTVTVVSELALSEDELAALARSLRQACATGGTVKEGRIEIQGDHRERIVTLLRERGFKARATGG